MKPNSVTTYSLATARRTRRLCGLLPSGCEGGWAEGVVRRVGAEARRQHSGEDREGVGEFPRAVLCMSANAFGSDWAVLSKAFEFALNKPYDCHINKKLENDLSIGL